MRRALALGVALSLTLAGVASAVGGITWKAPPFRSIGIAQVGVFASQFSDEGDVGLDFIVPTGSTSRYCLATLTEASDAWLAPTIFCNARQVEVDGQLVPGLRLVLAFGQPIPRDYYVALNVYQEGAQYYGAPLRCGVWPCVGY